MDKQGLPIIEVSETVSKMSRQRGALIVFEGCDRSGKSTQCKKLVDALTNDGIKAKLLRFPGRKHQFD